MKTLKFILLGCGTIFLIFFIIIGSIFFYYYLKSLPEKIDTTIVTVPLDSNLNIKDKSKFLNNLMLSPYWSVTKDSRGDYEATARTVSCNIFTDKNPDLFLFEYIRKSVNVSISEIIIKNDGISNHMPMHIDLSSVLDSGDEQKNIDEHGGYIKKLDDKNSFFQFSVSIVFRRPSKREISIGKLGKKTKLSIYNIFSGEEIGNNSYSTLAIKLSKSEDIYAIFYEQGKDLERITTESNVPLVLNELKLLANSAEKYYAKEKYSSFYNQLFSDCKSKKCLRRYPGIQDRDTFYGYLKTDNAKNYMGVNIKVSHPVFCPVEGTRKLSRLRKAEYLGNPYFNDDLLFFLISDNAIYLSSKYDERFGTFTGNESFEGNIEILNIDDEILLESKGYFKGWQR